MPVYEYKCKECGFVFEEIKSIKNKDNVVCPHCGSGVERIIGIPAIKFKGSGWYINDYAKKEKKRTRNTNKASKKTEDKRISPPNP